MVPSPITQESSQSSEVGTTNISLYTLFCGSQTTANSTDTNRRQSRSAGCGSWIFSGATSLLSAGYPLWTVTNFAEQDVVADSGHDFVKGMNVVPVHRVFAAGFATRIVGGGRQSQAGPCCECVSEGVGCRDWYAFSDESSCRLPPNICFAAVDLLDTEARHALPISKER